jgi:hypothetical protein
MRLKKFAACLKININHAVLSAKRAERRIIMQELTGQISSGMIWLDNFLASPWESTAYFLLAAVVAGLIINFLINLTSYRRY